MDYRLLAILAIIFWGLWGFMSKLLTRSTPVGAFALWATVAGILPVVLYALGTGTFSWTKTAPLSLLAGLVGSIATVCFYIALQRGPASVVVPLSGMYILIPALLGYLFLKEPLTLSHIMGLICAALALLFLTR
ncbi:MAG: DMT family transporter [candidate division WOR-3 bacterium]